MYNVYRLSNDGYEQSLGYYKDFDDVADAAEEYALSIPVLMLMFVRLIDDYQ